MTTKFHKLKLFLNVLIITILTNANLSAQSVGVNVETPDPSALMELHSTDKGFLPPRMSTEDRDDIDMTQNPVGLMIFNTDNNCIEFFDGDYWRNLCDELSCAKVGEINHGGKTYGAVYNPATGRCWLDRNLGATQVATSSTDEDAYGDLFQWGRGDDGHQERDSETYDAGQASTYEPNEGNDWDGKFILNSITWLDENTTNLWQGVNGTNNPCPTGWRIPTVAEWNEELLSWSTNNAAGAFASPLKLPVAGGRLGSSGGGHLVGSYGFYWTSEASGDYAFDVRFWSSDTSSNISGRSEGRSVRCLKDQVRTPLPQCLSRSFGYCKTVAQSYTVQDLIKP